MNESLYLVVGGQTMVTISKESDTNKTKSASAAAATVTAAPPAPPTVRGSAATAEIEAEDRAAYIPFTVAETVKANNELKAVAYSYSSSASSASSNGSNSTVSIDLHVTNLDQSIGAKEMKQLLTTVFKQHVIVMPLLFAGIIQFNDLLQPLAIIQQVATRDSIKILLSITFWT